MFHALPQMSMEGATMSTGCVPEDAGRPSATRTQHAIRLLTLLAECGETTDESDPADGLLGMDVLSNYLVVLDRARMRLKLLTPDDSETGDFRSWPSMSLTRRTVKNAAASLWLMRANVGGISVTSLLDMGSGMTILNWSAAEQLGLKRTSFPREGVPQKLRDALGTVEPIIFAKGLTIWMGGHVFTNQTVLIANVQAFRYFHLEGEPSAIIGSGLLKDNSLAIDFVRQRLYVGPALAEGGSEASPPLRPLILWPSNK